MRFLQCAGRVTYNGHAMDEFVPQRTSAYISQQDLHIGEMTVRETLSFSARCQGVGPRYGQLQSFHIQLNEALFKAPFFEEIVCQIFVFADMLTELSRREKAANIKPDPDLDIVMKVEYDHIDFQNPFSFFVRTFVFLNWFSPKTAGSSSRRPRDERSNRLCAQGTRHCQLL